MFKIEKVAERTVVNGTLGNELVVMTDVSRDQVRLEIKAGGYCARLGLNKAAALQLLEQIKKAADALPEKESK